MTIAFQVPCGVILLSVLQSFIEVSKVSFVTSALGALVLAPEECAPQRGNVFSKTHVEPCMGYLILHMVGTEGGFVCLKLKGKAKHTTQEGMMLSIKLYINIVLRFLCFAL